MYKKSITGVNKHIFYSNINLIKGSIIITAFIFIVANILSIRLISVGGGKLNTPGMMNISMLISIIAITIFSLKSSTAADFNSKRVFPLPRRSLATGRFLMMLLITFIFITLTTAFTFLELMINRLFDILFKNYLFVTDLSPQSIYLGVPFNFVILFLIGSVFYTISVYINTWKIPSLLFLGVIAVTFISEDTLWYWSKIVDWLFFTKTTGLFILRIFTLSIFFHLLSYIPLKFMEVNND